MRVTRLYDQPSRVSFSNMFLQLTICHMICRIPPVAHNPTFWESEVRWGLSNRLASWLHEVKHICRGMRYISGGWMIWGFPQIGDSSNHPCLDGLFPQKTTIFGLPACRMTTETPIGSPATTRCYHDTFRCSLAMALSHRRSPTKTSKGDEKLWFCALRSSWQRTSGLTSGKLKVCYWKWSNYSWFTYLNGDFP